MKKICITLKFNWDDGQDVKTMAVEVPKDVSLNKVMEEFEQGHEFLCDEDEEDRYGRDGRCPDTLAAYVCEKNGWTYSGLEVDGELELD